MIMEVHETAVSLRAKIDKIKTHYKELLILDTMKCVIFTANQYVVIVTEDNSISPEILKSTYLLIVEKEIERLEAEFTDLS